MAKFQIVSVKPFSGISKAGNAYSMIGVSGIFTGDDGVCEVGEVTFFPDKNGVLPTLEVGAIYSPVISPVSKAGKLEFRITELKRPALTKAA